LSCATPSLNKADVNETRRPSACKTPKSGFQDLAVVPLFDLLERSADFDGCRVVAGGFLNIYEAAGGELYLSRDDLVSDGRLFGKVRLALIPHPDSISLDEVIRAKGSFVVVKGRFSNTGVGPSIGFLEEFRVIPELGP
jgi:hypothetical protein